MKNIELWQLKFTADVAVNHQLNSDHVKAVQLAIIKAINENSDNNLVIGTTRMTIEPDENEKS